MRTRKCLTERAEEWRKRGVTDIERTITVQFHWHKHTSSLSLLFRLHSHVENAHALQQHK